MQSPASKTPIRIDPATVIAIACVLAGWFLMNTCVTTVGRLELAFRFYDMWDLIRRPTLLLHGIRGSHSTGSVIFGSLCAIAAAAPLLPMLKRSKQAWLASLVPLALMLLCGGILYLKVSPDYFAASKDAGDLGRELVGLANQIAGRVAGAAARHVSVGLGAYLSFLASLFLAWQGWKHR